MKNVALNAASKQPPKLLDQLRRCIRDKHYSLRTEFAYVYWARWYIRFHSLRHPADMGAAEMQAFLSYLANERNVSVSTHHQEHLTHQHDKILTKGQRSEKRFSTRRSR